MKKAILLSILSAAIFIAAQAQKKSGRITAYAITGAEKGNQRWTEVKLVDVVTGEVIRSVYESKSDVQRLNARTHKPIVIRETELPTNTFVYSGDDKMRQVMRERLKENNVVIIDGQAKTLAPSVRREVESRIIIDAQPKIMINTDGNIKALSSTIPIERTRVIVRGYSVKKEEPFATSSAACAYDKKHDRLYYTPMGINELRYIDLKAKKPSIFYFQDEAFSSVSGMGDVQNQITRMVIASDGNGYALNNSADQLIQFTTKKKPVITNLGAVTDDASNGKFSIRSRNLAGGDMVADDAGNLFLVTANRRVYKINIETRIAIYLGSIKGLPEGFTTNGAVVEKGTNIIVTSSTSTDGYYQFDLKAMQAEKISSGSVFNASDLANANLISYKKERKEKKEVEEVKEEVLAKEDALAKEVAKSIEPAATEPKLTVYPNPVVNAVTTLSLADYPAGRYEVQLLDQSGKQLNKQVININGKVQAVEFKLPVQIAKGTYLIRIMDDSNKLLNVEKIIVQ
ncbi:MAG: T9SS type A sorting domain-containing protein [Ferruginibacter sp.]